MVSNSQVTKHFYIESQRIATKLAESNEGLLQTTAGNGTVKYSQKQARLQGSINQLYADLGIEIEKVTDTAGNSGNLPPGQNGGAGTPPQNGNNGNGNDNTTGNAGGNGGGNGNNGNGNGNNGNGNGGGSTGNGNGTAVEKFIFYYHPDHLGSSSYISDANGEVTQHLEYFAFGETFLEEHSNTETTPYLFNGKELDEETGLYYYGARYYDARTSIWSSVDPLAEKYPNISPYTYCINNPLNVIDPDGRDIIILSHGRRGKTSVDGGKTNAHPHIVGHMAVLIGSDKKGWTYLSYDYDKGTNKGREKSGKNDVYTETTFKTLDDFKNSEHNTFKDDYDDGKRQKTSHRDANGNIIQRYQDAYQITTDATTDALMIDGGKKTFDKPWAQVSEVGQANQCTTVAEKALDAGGLQNGEMTPYIEIGGYEIGTRNYLPAGKQKGIEKRNSGTDVDSKIKRTGN